MSDALRLLGTRAVITGAVDGIGEAIVRVFAKHGARVLAVDAVDSGIDRQFQGLRNVTPVALRLTEDSDFDALVDRAAGVLGGLDVIVNNAFVQTRTPISDGEGARLDEMLERKLRAYAQLAQASLRHLEKSPAGRIVNIGCLRSAFAIDGENAYRRSELALADLTASQATDAGPRGTAVNYLQPGAVMTPASRRVFNADKALRDYCIRRSAAGRVGEPVDVAKVVLFLASDDSAFITGTGLVVDGGVRAAA